MGFLRAKTNVEVVFENQRPGGFNDILGSWWILILPANFPLSTFPRFPQRWIIEDQGVWHICGGAVADNVVVVQSRVRKKHHGDMVFVAVMLGKMINEYNFDFSQRIWWELLLFSRHWTTGNSASDRLGLQQPRQVCLNWALRDSLLKPQWCHVMSILSYLPILFADCFCSTASGTFGPKGC